MVLSIQCEPVFAGCMFVFERRDLAREELPHRQGGGASLFVGSSVDDVAFEIEVVAEVSTTGGELLK